VDALGHRMVALRRWSIRTLWKAMIWSSVEHSYLVPGQGLNGLQGGQTQQTSVSRATSKRARRIGKRT
jgi:hypothetical protein